MGRYEQPDYQVLESTPDYEIRQYESYLVAETHVPGTFETAGNTAFRRLAGFIFGSNSEGRAMNMTVPVTHREMPSGEQRYRFVMERAYDESTLPRPIDGSVEIVRVPPGRYAVASYRGGRSESRFTSAERGLRAALSRDGYEPTATAEVAVYDGPATPPFLRRNEVLIPLG